jgi:hypothetical protein
MDGERMRVRPHKKQVGIFGYQPPYHIIEPIHRTPLETGHDEDKVATLYPTEVRIASKNTPRIVGGMSGRIRNSFSRTFGCAAIEQDHVMTATLLGRYEFPPPHPPLPSRTRRKHALCTRTTARASWCAL